MPIYEFRCQACGERFEELVPAGTAAAACPACGANRAERCYSAQAPPFRLVKTPADARRQERRNARLRAETKARFKRARARARARARQARQGGGG